jgi:hypothetical protein
MPRVDTSPTPNPNSLKFTLREGTFIESGMESFNAPVEAEGHPLGKRLFEIEGVANVFILPQFLTITKVETARWNDVIPEVERVVGDELGR